MSASTKTPASVGVAPWRPLFDTHVSKMASPEFVFSSLHAVDLVPGEQVAAPTHFVPRARFCQYRGMWAELPENKHNEAPMNDRVYSSDLLTLTTDVRMAKIPEIFNSSKGEGAIEQSQGSGGGGPVEAVFWAKEVSTQWRFRGEAFVVAQDIEGAETETSGTRITKNKVGQRMRVVKEEGKATWSWAKELTAHFGNLSPSMRGSFKNPPPGTPVSIPAEKSLALGQKVLDLNDEVARKNFRVIVIVPQEVEQIDLTDADRARRWKFTFTGRGAADHVEKAEDDVGEWKTEELWP